MLEKDESGSATCWFKDNNDDDVTIAWFEDFASWHAGRISTSVRHLHLFGCVNA